MSGGQLSPTRYLRRIYQDSSLLRRGKISYFCSLTWKSCKGHSSEILQQDTPADSGGHHNPDEDRRTWNCGRDRYSYGRMVEGAWILGGIQRGNNHCFLTPCPGNLRDEPTLLRLILQLVMPGTTIITDGWKSYNNLNRHGYVHTDVNHSEDFVNPATGYGI